MKTAAAAITPGTRSVPFSALLCFTVMAVELQAVRPGLFLEQHGQRDAAGTWIDVHAHGGDIAIGLAVLANIVAMVKLRQRKDLWIGSVALTVLVVVGAYIGGLIRDASKHTRTALHVPPSMAIMAMVVWLPLRVHTRSAVS